MNEIEKYVVLSYLENKISETGIDEKDFNILNKLSFDKDDYIKVCVARILVNSSDKKSEDILIRLASDNNSLVRAEACDSLCISKSVDTYNILKNIVKKDRNGMINN